MININNEQDFIQFIKSIKELNKKHAINCQKTLQIKNATGYNLSNIASDPIIRDEYAKDVLMIDTTNKILQYVFNGLMCTIKPNEMTTTQNQFINAHFAEPQNHSLEEKQKMIKNNFLQQGMGNFNFAPLYNNYELGSQYFSNNNS